MVSVLASRCLWKGTPWARFLHYDIAECFVQIGAPTLWPRFEQRYAPLDSRIRSYLARVTTLIPSVKAALTECSVCSTRLRHQTLNHS